MSCDHLDNKERIYVEMAQTPSRKCDACKGETIYTAKVYCEECEQSLCKGCNDFHDRFCKDHHVFDINKAGNRMFKAKPVCEFHMKKFLFFCSTCKCLTCDECMTSSHNGHITDTIKKSVDAYRVNAKETNENLKAKVEIVQRTLETIKTKQTHQITSDFDSYIKKVEKTCRDIYGIVDHTKKIHMTAASDFQTNEKEDLDRKRVFIQRQYDESSGILLQIDNLLQESHDVTFFTEWKRLKTDVQNLTEIDQTLQIPKRIESFNEDNFMKTVMEDIDKRLTRRHENLAEVPELTTTRQFRKSSMASSSCLICAAIDIGNTYAGVAFSLRYGSKREPPLISTISWPGSKLLPFKAPTAVLLDSNQEFVAFGYEAENMYSELVADEAHEEYYYFHRFKMLLYDRRITRDIKIKDACDKEMEALTVFHYVIKFLKDRLFKHVSDKIKGIDENEIFYVLTVPAVLEDSAEQFMREAATKAGIKREHLSIALEPEAAAIYCQHFMTDRNNREKNAFEQSIKDGMKYMVVDLGGGSAYITVHQRYEDGSLKEVVPASCGPRGWKSIEEAFHGFLKRMFGSKVMEELRKTELEDFNDLCTEFENKMRHIRVDQTNEVVVTLPCTLIDLVESHRGKMKTALEQSPYGHAVSYNRQKLHISPDTFRDLFRSTTEALIKHLERMFSDDKLSDLKNLIMVGGFSECELIQHRMTKKFGKHKKIIIPEQAELAVLKGAVLYGNQPQTISARFMRRTYGIQSLWGPHMHPEYKKSHLVVVNRCKDLFFKFVEAGQKVETGHEVSQVFQVFKSEESNLEFTIYISIDPNPRYVTDPNCQRLGSLTIPLPDIRAGQTLEIEATMVFGDTEILVRARDLHSGRVVECQFDL